MPANRLVSLSEPDRRAPLCGSRTTGQGRWASAKGLQIEMFPSTPEHLLAAEGIHGAVATNRSESAWKRRPYGVDIGRRTSLGTGLGDRRVIEALSGRRAEREPAPQPRHRHRRDARPRCRAGARASWTWTTTTPSTPREPISFGEDAFPLDTHLARKHLANAAEQSQFPAAG
jgi:hypothetical protein